jgi:hypothetical protein
MILKRLVSWLLPTYLRRNRVRAEIGESFGVSQPLISPAVTALTDIGSEIHANKVTMIAEFYHDDAADIADKVGTRSGSPRAVRAAGFC